MAVGGGILNGGLVGEYYSNPDLEGVPSFVRKDARIDLDWGTTQAPGGSDDPGFRDLGVDNYSIRWTGQLIPSFSENYTIKLLNDEGARLLIRPSGEANWTVLVNDWTPHRARTDVARFVMKAGVKYDVELDYRELTGKAQVRLRWSSASTPEELLDTNVNVGLNSQSLEAAFADLVEAGSNNWTRIRASGVAGTDADGWPVTDAVFSFQKTVGIGLGIDPLSRGLVSFRFRGSAQVKVSGNVNSQSLTSTYDPESNTTSGSFRTVDLGRNVSTISFENSSRTGQAGGPAGITDLKLMRPTAPDSDASYPFDVTYITPYLDSVSNYTILRFLKNGDQEREWSDRTLPSFFNQSKGSVTAPRFGIGSSASNGTSWEYLIKLANQTGRDLYISLPTLATGRTAADSDSYLVKLAKLFKYGSDGVDPYEAPTADPVYPPLNPNLRLYLELGNELWNTAPAFLTSYRHLNALVGEDLQADNEDFQALNYDGLSTDKNSSGDYASMSTWRFRKLAQRTAQLSEIFRGVFGDSAMMTQVRPMFNYQGYNINQTASKGLDFLDRFYNNGDGVAHVATPHSVNYSIYGAGSVTYYRATNQDGATDVVSDPGFESTTVPSGYTEAPAGTPYSFSGTAGIARHGESTDGIPPAYNGDQVGYITDRGAIEFNVTVPTVADSNAYAILFRALNRKTGAAADREKLRVFVDGVEISAKSFGQRDGYVPPNYTGSNQWKSLLVPSKYSEYYSSKVFQAEPGSVHHVRIQGYGDQSAPSNTGQTAFLEDIRLGSADAIYASEEIPSSTIAGRTYQSVSQGEADWAHAYGLAAISYEGGWALGKDDGGSPLQLLIKYNDPRTREIQERAFGDFYGAGGDIPILGVYNQWASWDDQVAVAGMLNPTAYPLVQASLAVQNRQPIAPTGAIDLPASFDASRAEISLGANLSTSSLSARGGWVTWKVNFPRTGLYELRVQTATEGGSVVLLADENAVLRGETGSILSGTIRLTAGQHTLKLRNESDIAVEFSMVSGQINGALPPTTLVSAAPVLGSAKLNWLPVDGATSYVIRWGTTPGIYTNSLRVPRVTTRTIGGLLPAQTYYFAVDTLNGLLESLPSNELSLTL